ncbi:hypothetical protein BsWGS_15141 [Bradybaena similaris]
MASYGPVYRGRGVAGQRRFNSDRSPVAARGRRRYGIVERVHTRRQAVRLRLYRPDDSVGHWGPPPTAQGYNPRQPHQLGADSHGQTSVDSSFSSSHSRSGDRKSLAANGAGRKHEKGYSKSSDNHHSDNSHADQISSPDDKANFCHPHDGGSSLHGMDRQNNTSKTNPSDTGSLSRLDIDSLLQDEHLRNAVFAKISKATTKLEQTLKTTDKKLENDAYASVDDSSSRLKPQQSAQTSSVDALQKPKSILKRTTAEERVEVERKTSTDSSKSKTSTDPFSNLSALERTLQALRGKTSMAEVARASEQGSRGSEKPPSKSTGALRQLESYNDSGDEEHAEKDTKTQTKTKNAQSTHPFWSVDAIPAVEEKGKSNKLPDIQEQMYEQWRQSINQSSNVQQVAAKEQDVSKVNQVFQKPEQAHNLASSFQAKKVGDKDGDELDPTIKNILQSIGFNFDLSRRMQELARERKKQGGLHSEMINQPASALGKNRGPVQNVRPALFSDKQEKTQLDSLIKKPEASMEKRTTGYERSASPDVFNTEAHRSKQSLSHRGESLERDGRNRMAFASRESRSEQSLTNPDWEELSSDEDDMGGIESRKIIEKTFGCDSRGIRSEQSLQNLKNISWEGKSPHEDEMVGKVLQKIMEKTMGIKPYEIRTGHTNENLKNPDWEELSSDEDDMHGLDLRKVIETKRQPYEKHAEVRQQSFSRERDVASPPHSKVLLEEAQRSRNVAQGSRDKSLRLSEIFRDEKKSEHFHPNANEYSKVTALLEALSSKRKENTSSSSKSLKLPLQSGSGSSRVENLRVTSRLGLCDDKNDEPFIESRKVFVSSKSHVRSVSQSPDFRKSHSPEIKVPRKRRSPPPLQFTVSKEGRGVNEQGSYSGLHDVLMKALGQNAPEICEALGVDVDSFYKSALAKSVFSRLNVSGLPAVERAKSPIMSNHARRDSVRKAPDRQTLRSPGRHLSRSVVQCKSGSPGRQMSRSSDRRKSKPPEKQMSRSPGGKKSRLPERRMSKSPVGRMSKFPGRQMSRSPDRQRSRSPDRRRSRSRDRRRSRSPNRQRHRSPNRQRNRSPDRRGRRSLDRWRDRLLDSPRSSKLAVNTLRESPVDDRRRTPTEADVGKTGSIMPYQELGPPLDSWSGGGQLSDYHPAPPQVHDSSGGGQYSGYHPAPPPPAHVFPPESGYGPHSAGPQGYPGTPQPGFPFAGGQPQFGANMPPPQGILPPQPYGDIGPAPPVQDSFSGGQFSGYHPAPPPAHGFPPGSGYGPHNAGPQGYPGAPQPGFPFAGGQPQFGANMPPPQGIPPSQQYMDPVKRHNLLRMLSQKQIKMAALKSEMKYLLHQQNEILLQSGVGNAKLPQLIQIENDLAHLDTDIKRLMTALF